MWGLDDHSVLSMPILLNDTNVLLPEKQKQVKNQGNLKAVQGMGVFFLDYSPHSLDQWARPPRLACMAGRRFKMVYIDGANDSKA